jgi:uncharacterized protein
VKAGDIVKVKVLEVDVARQRIALTMRLDDPLGDARQAREAGGRDGRDARAGAPRGGSGAGARGAGPKSGGAPAPGNHALADAFARAKRN